MNDEDGWGSPCAPDPTDIVRCHMPTGGFFPVPAFVFGAWAVHRSISIKDLILRPSPSAWNVSHVPTGTALAQFVAEPSFWEAIRIARALDDSGLYQTARSVKVADDDYYVLLAVVGAALHDHYVWPLAGQIETGERIGG